MDPTSVTPRAEALKALAHPTRLSLLGLLRSEGPATATSLAARLGLNSGATSYHLRQLAQHGFIEEATDRGSARDRWWRAVHQSTFLDRDHVPPEDRAALDAYLQAVAVTNTALLQAAVQEQSTLPEEWRQASRLSDYQVRLTPARARALVAKVHEVLMAAEDEPEGAEGPEGAALFVVQVNAFPRPGQRGGGPS